MAFKVLFGSLFYVLLIKLLMQYLRKSPEGKPSYAANTFAGTGRTTIKEISIGVCAHNEEKNIRQLLDNLLWHQPLNGKALKEIIVVSSGSTDGTNRIVRDMMQSSNKIALIEEERRTGKSSAQNLVLSRASGDATVLVSADTYPDSGAINALVEDLSEGVGGVISHIRVSNPRKGTMNFNAHFTWELHNETNSRFSKLGILSHLGGDMFAIRTGVVRHIPPSVILDDAYLGSAIHRKGYSIVKSERAVVNLLGPSTLRDFLEQRSRNLAGHQQLQRINFASSTFEGMLFRHPILCLEIFVSTCARIGVKAVAHLPAIVSLEILAQIISRTRTDMEGLILWQTINTTKERLNGPDGSQG